MKLSYFLHKHQMKATKNSQAYTVAHMGVCNGQTDFALTLTLWPEKERYGCHTFVLFVYQYSYLVEQVEVLPSQFEWKSRDSPTETQLTDRYRSTDSLPFVTPTKFPVRHDRTGRMANDVTYTMYTCIRGIANPLRVQSML